MKIDYKKNGDYLVPNLVLKSNNHSSFGKYGRLRLEYLKHHKKSFL